MATIWEGENIRLRAIEPDDWKYHFLWNQDSDMPRGVAHIWFPQSQVAVKAWAEQEAQKRGDDEDFFFEIETLSGDYVGFVSTHDCNPRVGTFSFGIGIMPQHQRHGYASEALLLVLRYYFHERRYQKVTSHVYSFNKPSIRLHESLGFLQEGCLRRMVFTQGVHHDELIYGMTVEEFDAHYAERLAVWAGVA
jgi:RimJ/RimL family protein N-acetyltransferase